MIGEWLVLVALNWTAAAGFFKNGQSTFGALLVLLPFLLGAAALYAGVWDDWEDLEP
jgi:hypothetical protein